MVRTIDMSETTRHEPSFSPHKAWQAALDELQLQVTSDIYEMYLHPTRFLAYGDGTFLVAVPNGFVKDWLDLRLSRIVKRTLRTIVHREVDIKYEVQIQASRAEQLSTQQLSAKASQADSEFVALSASPIPDQGLPLVANYTFDTFVVGPNNRLAHAASVAVADRPGSRYNPLFIYSGVGLGKTHLMHAIAHRCRQNGYKAVYVSCETFTNELVTSIRTNTQEQFRTKYRKCDLLLVDNVHYLLGKPSTQEELFFTFNALHEAGKQVVLACDRPPRSLSTLVDRLRARFEWGLIADIQAPDLETRLSILEAKCASLSITVPYALLEHIAFLVPTNIKILEGALIKVAAHADLNGVHLTPERIETLLSDMMPLKAEMAPEKAVDLVASYFDLSQTDLVSRSRKREIAQARQVAMYLLRAVLNMSYVEIGTLFGGRDYATVMYNVDRVASLMLTDDVVQRQIETLTIQLTAQVPAIEHQHGSRDIDL